ncbi:hypothetical protein I4F81_005837 [Pyropia yezoensis]|uniref:Uncharacterized protein n=1 Tax=Pyropia yezoensis TaxID=2788 RepID=A0ACC3BZL9_PYRYE|nr:hypothetical protein I4F81_005837 [Neopyropia yezoensis]
MAAGDGSPPSRAGVRMVTVSSTGGGGGGGGGDSGTDGGDRQPLLPADGHAVGAAAVPPPQPAAPTASARASGWATPPRPSVDAGGGSGHDGGGGRPPASPPWAAPPPPPPPSPPAPEPRLLTLFDLTMIGVGGTLGAGIFVLAGVAARDVAGPGVVLSFVAAGAACLATGLSYAEMASRTVAAGRPAGGAYSFAAATLGRTPAFLVGWALSVEFGVASAAVARAWAAYVATVVPLPRWLVGGSGGGASPLAAGLIVAIVAVTVGGMKEAAWLVNASALLYAAVVVAVVAAGLPHVDAANYTPFLPFGFSGALSGAAVCFFAYVGFDEVASFADEAAAPARDVPRAILGSLAIVSLLYAASSAVLVGMVPYRSLDPTAAFAAAFRYVGSPRLGACVAVATALGMQNTALMGFAAQPRVLGAMANDGLLPAALALRRPTTVACGVVVAALAGAVRTTGLTDAVSAATLLAFLATNAALLLGGGAAVAVGGWLAVGLGLHLWLRPVAQRTERGGM